MHRVDFCWWWWSSCWHVWLVIWGARVRTTSGVNAVLIVASKRHLNRQSFGFQFYFNFSLVGSKKFQLQLFEQEGGGGKYPVNRFRVALNNPNNICAHLFRCLPNKPLCYCHSLNYGDKGGGVGHWANNATLVDQSEEWLPISSTTFISQLTLDVSPYLSRTLAVCLLPFPI